jgi:hypothetical protein
VLGLEALIVDITTPEGIALLAAPTLPAVPQFTDSGGLAGPSTGPWDFSLTTSPTCRSLSGLIQIGRQCASPCRCRGWCSRSPFTTLGSNAPHGPATGLQSLHQSGDVGLVGVGHPELSGRGIGLTGHDIDGPRCGQHVQRVLLLLELLGLLHRNQGLLQWCDGLLEFFSLLVEQLSQGVIGLLQVVRGSLTAASALLLF